MCEQVDCGDMKIVGGIDETGRNWRAFHAEVKTQVQQCTCWDREMTEESGMHWKVVDGEPLQVGQGYYSSRRNTGRGRG